jgi:uncharacterized protein with HEPN domain
MYTSVKNPSWADELHTQINCEVNFSHLPEEFVNFTASPDDIETYSQEIFSRALAGEFGEIQEYIPPFLPEQLTEMKWTALRQERDRLLYQTDWTQLPVNPLTAEQKVLWETYRQALRDLPSNTLDIDNVVWPTPP